MPSGREFNDENDPSQPILTSDSAVRDFTSIRMTEGVADSAGSRNGAENDVRMNVLRTGHEQTAPTTNVKFYVYAVVITNIPQLVAAIVVLSLSLNKGESCSEAPLDLWVIVQCIRLAATVYLALCLRRENLRDAAMNSEYARWLGRVKTPIDNLGLVWLVMGNIWLFNAEETCDESAPMLVSLCTGMIYIGFIAIFLPCIIIIIMLPFVCFCLPCVIRVLATVVEVSDGKKGASQADLDGLPTIQYTNGILGQQEEQCSICLNNYKEDETMRLLPCDKRHHFHKECVDEWLILNATCPICRARVVGTEADEETGQSNELEQV